MFFVVVVVVVGLGVCRLGVCSVPLVVSRPSGRCVGRFISPFLGGGGLPSALLVLLTVVRCFVVIVCFAPLLLACVLVVLGVRFLPRVGHIGFVLRSVSALVVAVVRVESIRICCLCKALLFAPASRIVF